MKHLGAAAFAVTALFFATVSFSPIFHRSVFHKLTDFGLPQPSQQKIGDMWTDPASGIDFMWVPSGMFTMGCSYKSLKACIEGEKPRETMKINGIVFGGDNFRAISSFWLSRTEVTQAQWERVMGNNPSAFKGENHPVDNISWDDAQAFIGKLNNLSDDVFRLPRETEWEYACRSGGKNERYCGGDDPDLFGWHSDNKNKMPGTSPVATKQPNGLGIYDMSGNVWEWVADCKTYSCDEHIIRGGSILGHPGYMHSAQRYDNFFSNFKNVGIGFRIARKQP